MKIAHVQLVIVLILTFQSNFSLGQGEKIEPANLRVFYNLTWQEDSLNPYHLQDEKMVLLIGDQYSMFLPYGAYFRDSVRRTTPNFDMQAFFQSNISRMPFHFFRIKKNFNTGQITTSDRLISGGFFYNENMNDIRWQLTNETSQIKGYRVQKATTNFGGRTWEAWFTETIPFRDGPYKFSGLPGLILKVRDTRGHYIFEIVSINTTNENIYFRNLSNLTETNKRQFFELRRKFSQDAANMIRASGVPLHQDQIDNLRIVEENMRRRNNPIELSAD